MGRGGAACRGGTFKYCKFVNFQEGCIFAKLHSEDALSIERICASSGSSLYYVLLSTHVGHCSGI